MTNSSIIAGVCLCRFEQYPTKTTFVRRFKSQGKKLAAAHWLSGPDISSPVIDPAATSHRAKGAISTFVCYTHLLRSIHVSRLCRLSRVVRPPMTHKFPSHSLIRENKSHIHACVFETDLASSPLPCHLAVDYRVQQTGLSPRSYDAVLTSPAKFPTRDPCFDVGWGSGSRTGLGRGSFAVSDCSADSPFRNRIPLPMGCAILPSPVTFTPSSWSIHILHLATAREAWPTPRAINLQC